MQQSNGKQHLSDWKKEFSIWQIAVVRPALGYATQVWAPQTIDLIRRIERVQQRASKFILD